MAKDENPEMSEINRKLSNKKKQTIVNGYHDEKTAKKLPVWYLNTILG